MAPITLETDDEFAGERVYEMLSCELPAYAGPLFVRVGDGQNGLTETYKLELAAMKMQGYSPDRVDDPLFRLDSTAKRYVPVTERAFLRAALPPFDSEEIDSPEGSA